MSAASLCLFSYLTWTHSRCSSGLSTWARRASSRSKLVTHWSFSIQRVMSFASPGLHWFNQRLGVMPFVLFWNLSGQTATKSAKSESLRIWEWMAATPLTANEPTMARLAMRTILGVPSSTMLSLASLFPSPRHFFSTSISHLRLISKMICVCRGSRLESRSTDHFSSASGKTVWLVYANVFVTMSQADSQVRSSSSIRMRMSSTTPMVGWVSLSWTAILEGISVRGRERFLNLRRVSRIVALTKKYCCLRRNSLPA
mmetsp:Transcript_15458/g.26592  ORF Transcript_15458/g.26592 Transcript_15458/m.26592 type:complete len:257 (+) Transcript_15458:1387-2157(+)